MDVGLQKMTGFEEIFPSSFPFFFIGMWCFVLGLLSLLSGWTKLAGQFHSSDKFVGKY